MHNAPSNWTWSTHTRRSDTLEPMFIQSFCSGCSSSCTSRLPEALFPCFRAIEEPSAPPTGALPQARAVQGLKSPTQEGRRTACTHIRNTHNEHNDYMLSQRGPCFGTHAYKPLSYSTGVLKRRSSLAPSPVFCRAREPLAWLVVLSPSSFFLPLFCNQEYIHVQTSWDSQTHADSTAVPGSARS